ncbi:augmenter of liver regeneration [Microdochium trichocladiopsis]|uniref:Sulfhydryl oxidase n=1 Tax=Microdochium trichocladiopsis TaxID=1682393 RepID=A0A9P8Y5G5_9PEZI|nr:augmenter of liver regeneration [Microdochium trichocladiopsis]KAH7029385.1 augmenter of liver regeneration [Microdochium trichocladiopsis]
MAADSRETTSGVNGAEAQKLPPGMVLGKDGKPCRSCTSGAAFKSWSASMKSSAGGVSAAGFGAAATAKSPPATPNDCPADVETLGRSTWTLLHSIAATYPKDPSPTQQSDLRTFLGAFSRLYPCWVCADDFQTYMAKEQLAVGSRDEFGKWLCEAHNAVNTKLGKDTFDCNKWEERWRTGWKDGRCD